MGVLRVLRSIASAIGIIIGIIIGFIIVLFLALLIIVQIVSFNEKAEAAYNSSYQEVYVDSYDVGFKEGYDKEHELARDVSYQEGYNQGYDKGFDEGYQSGLAIGFKEGLPPDVIIRNPTYKELMDFLRRDKTNLRLWIEHEYVSFDFAADVHNNAELEGIRAAFVGIDYPQPPGHGMVAFQTVDKGLIFIEPQLDTVAKPFIGKSYFQSLGFPPPRDYDDTVVKIQIIW